MPPTQRNTRTTEELKELAETNLRYVGEKRLLSMEDAELMALARFIRIESDTELQSIQKADLIRQILQKKQERASLGHPKSPLCPTSAAVIIQERVRVAKRDTPVLVPSPSAECEIADRNDALDDTKSITNLQAVIKKRHKLRVVAFNSLKLRLSVLALREQWSVLMKSFANFDVILVSEVPSEPHAKAVEETRAYGMKHLLNMYSHELNGREDGEEVEDIWQIALSKPSGPGNPEVHAVFAKRPVDILRFTTNFNASGTALDHAPACVVVFDDRFEDPNHKTWAFSSVHFPPKARMRERDAQLKAFLSAYSTNAEFRCDAPFTAKGAKDAKLKCVHHVVAGDFNCYPDEETFELQKHGFAAPLLGEHISTSAGENAYDNFLVCSSTEKSFALNRTVLELEMHQKPVDGTAGVSDHSPILLSIQEMPATKNAPTSGDK